MPRQILTFEQYIYFFDTSLFLSPGKDAYLSEFSFCRSTGSYKKNSTPSPGSAAENPERLNEKNKIPNSRSPAR